MGILARIKRLRAAWTDPLGAVVSSLCLSTDSGQLVSIATASRVATLTAGINLLANDVSSLPLNLMQRTPEGPKYAVNHPLAHLLSSEWNPEVTAREGLEHSMRMLLSSGNFFNLLKLDRMTDEVLAIFPLYAPNVVGRRLDAAQMKRLGLDPSTDSNLVWDYSDPETASVKTFHDSSIWRASIYGKYALVGEGLVSLGKQSIGTAIAADKAGARLFKKGTIGDVYFQPQVGKDLSPEGWKNLMAAWERGADGSYSKPSIPEGINVNKLEAPTAQQAQFIERLKRQDIELCRLLGIPASILDASEKGETFAASESQRRWFVDHTLRPYLRLIEQSINARCLSTREKSKYYAEFDADDLTMADKSARYTANKLATGGASFLTINEVRAEENRPPVPGGDVLLVPANNLGTLTESGQIIPPAAPSPQDKSASRLKALATIQAERIVRKEAKSGKFDHEFVCEVLCITPEQAQQYCAARFAGKIADADAVSTLVTLAMEETK